MAEKPPNEHLGTHGEPCASCGAPLATDQRYCLSCGMRRGEARVPFMALLEGGTRPEPEPVPVASPAQRPFEPTSVGIAVGVVVLLLGFGTFMGTLLARLDDPQRMAVAGTGNGPGTALAAAGPSTAGPFTSDWPKGTEGFTVQLKALKKDSTNAEGVAGAKGQATAEGAKEVGALDSDGYPSLDKGNYLVYSGVFEEKKDADVRLVELQDRFPEAKVVRVAAEANKDVAKSDGADKKKEKKTKKTDTVEPPEEAEFNAATAKDKVTDAELTQNKETATVSRRQLAEIEKVSGDSRKAAKLPKTIKVEGKAPRKEPTVSGGTGIGF